MRSLSARGASLVNRSGGIHGMLRWQSAEIRRYCMTILPGDGGGSVESEIDDMLGVGLELAALDPLDDVGQRGVGGRGDAELLALAHDEAVQELDLGAPSLGHVLAHRRLLRGGTLLAVGEA